MKNNKNTFSDVVTHQMSADSTTQLSDILAHEIAATSFSHLHKSIFERLSHVIPVEDKSNLKNMTVATTLSMFVHPIVQQPRDLEMHKVLRIKKT